MVVGFQETCFRTQWHCYYTRQVRRIPVSIPRSSSGYKYQYLYLYDIKPALRRESEWCIYGVG